MFDPNSEALLSAPELASLDRVRAFINEESKTVAGTQVAVMLVGIGASLNQLIRPEVD